ncbi:hypothetical protein FM106_09200 [Brachybacterium faecium]|nr:hypothetical protein FM106_09200 [Brachybacterium faecium]
MSVTTGRRDRLGHQAASGTARRMGVQCSPVNLLRRLHAFQALSC